jgi:hypothetical protein
MISMNTYVPLGLYVKVVEYNIRLGERDGDYGEESVVS